MGVEQAAIFATMAFTRGHLRGHCSVGTCARVACVSFCAFQVSVLQGHVPSQSAASGCDWEAFVVLSDHLTARLANALLYYGVFLQLIYGQGGVAGLSHAFRNWLLHRLLRRPPSGLRIACQRFIFMWPWPQPNMRPSRMSHTARRCAPPGASCADSPRFYACARPIMVQGICACMPAARTL